MLIMKYSGGLGNQMFQYASVLTLASKINADFSFDMSYFSNSYARPYQMNIFGIEKKESRDLRAKIYWKIRRLHKGVRFLGLNLYSEKSFNFEERFFKTADDTFISGFFQSYKYFDEELVRKSFVFKTPSDEKNAQYIKKMQSENSVSLHVRRGDYTKKRYDNVYKRLDIDYYKKAVEIMSEKLDAPVFYVFSDDIDWVKENLNFENHLQIEYVSHNTGEKSYEDMRLMAACRNNIIANSTFSWWGAYLNANPEKTVIAPKQWFCDEQKTTVDIYPPEWIKI